MIRKQRLVGNLRKLIRINSENPPGNEEEISRWVGNYLKRLGLTVRYAAFGGSRRPNVIAVLKGVVGGKGLLLTPHLDTVPAGKRWHVDPFGGAVKGGKVWGRGATDCKGNLACAIEAIESLVEEGVRLRRDLVLAATVDEECGNKLGIIPLIERGVLKPAAALVLDADEFDVIVAQKGLLHLKVEVFGKRAHGAYPDRGVNAIEVAAKIIHELKRMRFEGEPHPLLKAPTVNIGTIRGGDKVNIVADHCEFEADVRFLPGMDARRIVCTTRRLVGSRARRYAVEVTGLQDPYEIDEECVLVRSLAGALVLNGKTPRMKGSEGATVITFFKKKGIPAVAFGFGSKGQAHVTDEYVRIRDLSLGSKVLRDFIVAFDPCTSPASKQSSTRDGALYHTVQGGAGFRRAGMPARLHRSFRAVAKGKGAL